MKVVIFGTTGMIGRGVLLEALDSPDVTGVLSVVRHRSDVDHPKLRQIAHDDFEDCQQVPPTTRLTKSFDCEPCDPLDCRTHPSGSL